MALRTEVVDDEQLAREELCFLLERTGSVEIVGQAANGVDGLRLVGEHQPDLLLLDVQMPGLNGFEVAHRLMDASLLPNLVFVTAYDQYALDAFKVNAVDYLLKPVDADRLDDTLERVRRKVETDQRAKDAVGRDELERMLRAVSE
jgi:YesN/AraC family two-component response regulator